MFNDGTNYGNVRYDDKGQAIALRYKSKEYFFIYNAQGDVVVIAKHDGTIVVEYTYDAWGKILTCTGSMASTLGKYNPFRYRGYVYDEETGLYYLNSRYYDPKVGRFICADGVLLGQTDILPNLYCYCTNNPVMEFDPNGQFGIFGALIGIGIVALVATVTSLLSGCSNTSSYSEGGIDRLRIGNHDYSKANCVGYGYLEDVNVNIGQLGGEPVDQAVFQKSEAYSVKEAENLVYQGIQADAKSDQTWFNSVKRAPSADAPIDINSVRIAVMRSTNGDVHVLRRTSLGTWWHKEGNSIYISFYDNDQKYILDPQCANIVSRSFPCELIGYYDLME